MAHAARVGDTGRLRLWAKRLLFPGLNLHARQRYRVVAAALGRASGERWVLDAGCGNGMLAFAAWKKGNRVIGITLKEKEVAACHRYFNVFLGIPEQELQFRKLDIRQVSALGRRFSEIICCEVLEHIPDDRNALEQLRSVHLPGGMLHLTVPNADHPDNASADLDLSGGGGHVRPGYTPEQLEKLLSECGYRPVSWRGLGGRWRQWANRRLIAALARQRVGAAALWWVVGCTLSGLDPAEPEVPYILYVRAAAAEQ